MLFLYGSCSETEVSEQLYYYIILNFLQEGKYLYFEPISWNAAIFMFYTHIHLLQYRSHLYLSSLLVFHLSISNSSFW